MPWKEESIVSLRKEFVMLASLSGTNKRELCRRYGISPKTGYKWLSRYQAGEESSLEDKCRKPLTSPLRTSAQMEDIILALRDTHPAWGGRKLRARLNALGHEGIPASSTITEILRRNNRLEAEESLKHKAWKRFEHEQPNDLWQMDFKGHFPLETGERCHPLTLLDDHSRYAVCLEACGNEQGQTVQQRLTQVFRRYGLPNRMTMDNGSPWGGAYTNHPYTTLTVWLIRLGIGVSHSRPYHPQTQGKDERFHRTLGVEVIRGRVFKTLAECQKRFDDWRGLYNLERPHEALDMLPPASRYKPSARSFPETLPEIEYSPNDIVRKVHVGGRLFFEGRLIRVHKAFAGQPVGLRPTGCDGTTYDLYFCHHKFDQLNLKTLP
jgi:transposase InsO family protein